MPRKVVTVTHPDGTRKIIVSKDGNSQPIKTRKAEEDKRPKPETPFTGLTKERNAYKHGGKFKLKTR